MGILLASLPFAASMNRRAKLGDQPFTDKIDDKQLYKPNGEDDVAIAFEIREQKPKRIGRFGAF